MNVGKKITELRTKRGYTVNKLANIAGISQGFLRQIELGQNTPGIETLSYICDALEIPLYAFFKEETKEEKNKLVHSITKNLSLLSTDQLQVVLTIIEALAKQL